MLMKKRLSIFKKSISLTKKNKNIEILSVFIGALLVFATSQIIFWLDPDFQTISFESFDIILNGPAVAVTKIFFTS